MYGLFSSARPSDQKEFAQIEQRYESKEGENDGWEVLQRRIVKFQEEEAKRAKGVS